MNLQERFTIPPFSVWDTKQGYWQNRRTMWLAYGIRSEEGRQKTLLKMSNTILEPDKEKREKRFGECNVKTMSGLTPDEYKLKYGRTASEGTSIFDPVICELCYKWFCPVNGTILDPFAGGSVRGIIAQLLGYKYTGIELREEQVQSNINQASIILKEAQPIWIVGDSMEKIPKEEFFDMVFTCPPYFDLEVYSDSPNDLSNKNNYDDFLVCYEEIIKKSNAQLLENRFFVIVVSNFRDDHGNLYDFCGDTIKIMKHQGLSLYNEIVLINSIGTLPLRVNKSFGQNRKVGKMHQNVLVFFKGKNDMIKNIYKNLNIKEQNNFW